MALADGDYKAVEEKVVATLLDDTESGGLREQGSPAVSTVLAADVEVSRFFAQADYPAILVRATAKKESPSAPACSMVKAFKIVATVLEREMDRDAAEESVRKIAARLEQVLRDQTRTDKQFMGLPDLIDCSEGVLVCIIQATGFAETEAGQDQVIARAQVEAEIQVPCAFRYE
jgi:hypothetical protein